MFSVQTIRRWLSGLVRAAMLLWLVVHFTLTVLYVTPLNPVKMQLQPLLDATIGTYFPQNWSLFAPNPLSSDQALLVRPLTASEFAKAADEGLPPDGWYDLSTPFWARFQQNRFSAYDRLIRAQSNAIRSYLTGGPEMAPWWEACRNGDQAACDYYARGLEQSRVQAGKLLARVGSAFCKDVGCDEGFAYVAVRVRERSSVPWSKRYTAQPEVRDTELGVYPVDRDVASTGLYVIGGR